MAYVEGFTAEIQRDLLAIAAQQGLSPAAVQPNTWHGANGWTVPDSVAQAYADGLVAAAAPKKRASRKAAAAPPAEEAPAEAPSDPEGEQE